MDKRKQEKIERYLKNATRFLWGLGPGNQKENYKWLKEKGFDFNNGTYSYVTNQLLERDGIEKILNQVIIPRVKELFSEKAIDFLRENWRAGTRPNISFLRLHNVQNASPFLEVNTQFNYVERWGELVGVWFEEIEEAKQ